jgi:hypothetical protein
MKVKIMACATLSAMKANRLQCMRAVAEPMRQLRLTSAKATAADQCNGGSAVNDDFV